MNVLRGNDCEKNKEQASKGPGDCQEILEPDPREEEKAMEERFPGCL